MKSVPFYTHLGEETFASAMPYVFLMRYGSSQWEYVDWTEWSNRYGRRAPVGYVNGSVRDRDLVIDGNTKRVSVYADNCGIGLIVHIQGMDMPASCFDVADSLVVWIDQICTKPMSVRYPPPGKPTIEWKCPYYVGNLDIGVVPINIAENVFNEAPPRFCDEILNLCTVGITLCSGGRKYIKMSVIPHSGFDEGVLARKISAGVPQNKHCEMSNLLVQCSDVSQHDWIYFSTYSDEGGLVSGLYERDIWDAHVIDLVCPGLLVRVDVPYSSDHANERL